MSRSVQWRRLISDVCSWRQDEALNATIYILRETGPTGFLVKEDGESKKSKVYLGDPHSCTCPEFKKDKDLCKHICWVLLKKFRIPRQNPVTWQLGLVEREINEILRGIATRQQGPSSNARKLATQAKENEDANSGNVKQREIGEDDVCPICQDELLEKRLPVTYCKFGCGNNVHIKCMKVWAEHQKTMGSDMVKCPMCREDFGPISLLQQEFRNSSVRETRAQMLNEHLGTSCKKCYACPIVGKCYKCTICGDYYLCQACFNTPTHDHHNFNYREKANQRWRDAPRFGVGLLPDAVVQNLMNRDISETDYDLLLQLDSASNQQLSNLTEDTVQSFPMERVRPSSTLLAPGQQCRVCLRPYQEGQYVRRLLCKHKFHRECIDNWLLHQHPTCPVDGTVFTNDSVHQIREASRLRNPRAQAEANVKRNGRISSDNTDVASALQIPGIGISSLGNSRLLDRHMNGLLEVSGISNAYSSDNIHGNSLQNSTSAAGNLHDISQITNSNAESVEHVNSNQYPGNNFIANRQLNPAFPSGHSVINNTATNGSSNHVSRSVSNGRSGGQINRGRLRSHRSGSGRNQLNRTGSGLAVRAQNTSTTSDGQNNPGHRRNNNRSDIEWETLTLNDNSHDVLNNISNRSNGLHNNNLNSDRNNRNLVSDLISQRTGSSTNLNPLDVGQNSGRYSESNTTIPRLSVLHAVENQHPLSVLTSSNNTVLNPIENHSQPNDSLSVLCPDSSNIKSVLNGCYINHHGGPAEEHVGQLSFANLLRSDIQRSMSRQSNSSEGEDHGQNDASREGNTVQPVIISTNSEQTLISGRENDKTGGNNVRTIKLFNGNDSNDTSQGQAGVPGKGEMTRAGGRQKGKGKRVSVLPFGNRSCMLSSHEPGGENNVGLTTMDLDISGRGVMNGNIGDNDEKLSHKAVNSRSTSENAVKVPVAPSIPLPRDAQDISLGGVISEETVNNPELLVNPKPPSGSSSASKSHGRLRTRFLNKELHRIRSNSRERTNSAEGRQNQRELYIGNDPTTSAGFSNNFLLSTTSSTNPKAPSSHVTKYKIRNEQGLNQSDDRYRWGATQNLTGSDIMLSGNAL